LTIVEEVSSSPIETENKEATSEAGRTGIWLALFIGLSVLATLVWIGALAWALSTLIGFL
jgi:hypothetical protein